MKNIVILFSSVLTLNSHAGDLKPAFLINSANVLPKGVRNLTYLGAFVDGNKKYANDGTIVNLSEPFSKDITFQELMDGKTDPTEKGSIQQAMYSIGASPNDSFGQTQGQVNVEAMAHATVFAWGLTDKITVATAIPILQSSVNVSVGMQQTNASLYQSMIQALEDKGASKKASEFDTKMMNPINAKARDYNYESVENENKTELGDIKLLSKFLVNKNDESRFTLQTEVTLPTGRAANPNKLVTVASGDDQTDVGLSAYYDYLATDTFTLSTSLGHIVQLKDSRTMRIPERSNSKITPDLDENTSRNLGDISFLQTSAVYQNNYKFGVSYTFQYKTKDEFSGTKFDQTRYSWMANETLQRMQSIHLNLGYETLTAFRAKKFPVPFIINLNHALIVDGKNVVKDPISSIDFNLYF